MRGHEPVFAIAIPAYEDVSALERAIRSLKSQSLTDWTCLIGDDSASDAIEKMMSRNVDGRIHYIRNHPAKGVPENWNCLVSRAKGQYINLLHQDDFYVHPDVLENVRRALRKSGAKFGVCARSVWKNGDKIATYDNNGHAVKRFPAAFPSKTLVINRIGHPSVIFFAKELKATPFDERLRYFVDTDWYARLWEAGGNPVYIQDAEIGMEQGRSGQLSQKCLLHFDSLDAELEMALKKWNASAASRACAFARFYMSHLRRLSTAWPALKRRVKLFSPGQKCVCALMMSACFWHMCYRHARKKLGFKPWA